MGRYTENKMVIDGTTVRFFGKRSDAINEANLRTKGSWQQHSEIIAYVNGESVGYLVENRTKQEYFDIDGKVPENVIEVLKNSVKKR